MCGVSSGLSKHRHTIHHNFNVGIKESDEQSTKRISFYVLADTETTQTHKELNVLGGRCKNPETPNVMFSIMSGEKPQKA